jgi:voltage-gated potassium channel
MMGRRAKSVAGRHLLLALTAAGVILLSGTVAYSFIEHLSLLNALYLTVGLMSTAGSFEHPHTAVGRALAVVLIILGISSLFYTLGSLTEYLIEGHLGRALVRRRMDRRIEHLEGHAIICGFGRVGRRIAQEFAEVQQPFVVVDPKEGNAGLLQAQGFLYVQGDASTDATLLEAGILKAWSLLAATDVDTENIAITLSARALAPQLWIVARANREESEAKLRRAGADRVLSPYTLGGHRMASLARQPHLVDFLDTAMRGGDLELALEEVAVEPGSPLIGVLLPPSPAALPPGWQDRTIIAIRPATTTHWIAVSRRKGMPVNCGDCLIVIGPAEQRRKHI